MTRLITLPALFALALLPWTPARAATGFIEETVEFSTHDGLVLGGIVSHPNAGAGPWPGVLLVHGSGLHDADLTLNEPVLRITRGEQKLFRTLARYLSRRGFTVLRYNKRGASFDHANDAPTDLAEASIEDLVDDAHEAFRTLAAHPRTAAAPLVVYGFSEGTLVGSRLARREPRIDLLVLVGSVASKMSRILRYQYVDRNIDFFEQAADANGDGHLTLAELDALDGNHGLGSVYVLNTADTLFDLGRDAAGDLVVHGLAPGTDDDGDGRLDIRGEIRPVLVDAADALLRAARSGAEGRYVESLVKQRGPISYIHKIDARILFAQGELDFQAPVEETLALIAKLEAKDRENWDALFFPQLGHSLSKPNDFYRGDGGLSIYDNPTLNAMKKRTMKKILARIRAAIE